MRKKVQVQKIVKHSVKTMFKRAATNGAHSDLVGWSKKNRKVLSKEATYYERVVKNFLERRGAICVPQAPFFFQELNKMCFADIYVPEGEFIIEVDGGYHNTPEQAASDKLRDACFLKRGYNVIRIKNSEAKKDILKERLAPVLASAKPFKQIKAELRAERDAKKAKGREDRLNGEGRWKPLQSVNEVLLLAQENSEVLFVTDNKKIAGGIICAYQYMSGIYGVSGEIATTIRQKHLKVYVWWEDRKLPDWLNNHRNSLIAEERRRISKDFPKMADYFERAHRV